ncbi:hypothetical protein KP509_18G030900 [Ceratopteris richardii]|uniref:Uncharacterized protein n=1 Tax=Ceratopteris richardii TaxID=49495 RepID=A0A8T2ST06_CERRI|nr:hypothetical protein KP509_18G030900 [Ceratopteris richardii]
MLCIHSMQSFASSGQGSSGVPWTLNTPVQRLVEGACMRRKQAKCLRSITVFSLFGISGSRNFWDIKFVQNSWYEFVYSSEHRLYIHDVTPRRRSLMNIRAMLSNCSTEGSDRDVGCIERKGHMILRALLLGIASVVLFCSNKVEVAAALSTNHMVGISSLPQQLKNGINLLGPKILQVLSVFRDQGLILSLLLGLSAFFSMAETSITTLWPWKVRELAEKETDSGVFNMLKQDVTRFLTTILIGTTVANIAATALVTDAATALFGEAGVSAATGVMTVVILLVTEITPKSIAVHNATEVARFVVKPVAWLSYVLYPVGRIVTSISMALLQILGLKSSGELIVTEEELKLMLRGAELSGAIEEEEQDMIKNVLEIKDTHVREVMTPLVDVVAIDSRATVMDFCDLWVTHQYSRVPVFERRVDNIVGIAYAMDMLEFVEQAEVLQKYTVGRIAHKPAYFVPDSMSVWNLLREFRIRKVHMAIVLNEYGGTVGLVTLEDVVEEIVGEIFDENDSKEEIRRKTGYIVQRADGVFDVDANTSIEDLAEALEVKLPEVPYHYETVSGFVCEAFGYIPRTGESIKVILKNAEEEDPEGDSDTVEDNRRKFRKYRLEILAGNARKVGSVRFERIHAAEDQGATVVETRKLSPVPRHRWQEQEFDHVNIDVNERPWQTEEDFDTSEDDGQENTARRGDLIVDNMGIDSFKDSEGTNAAFIPFSRDQERGFNMQTRKGSRGRRRQKRRKGLPEATVELDRDRKFYLKRKEK